MPSRLFKTMRRAVTQGGKLALKYFGRLNKTDIHHKGPRDLVTEADMAVESFVRKELRRRFPDVAFLGEESSSGEQADGDKVFILDPIDGTSNFVHRIPFFSVSLAYAEKGKVLAGMVYVPCTRDLYHAGAGTGAFRNARRISVSGTADLMDSLVCTGFACIRNNIRPDNMRVLNKAVYRVRGFRRLGSAAIDLCFVAEGRLELFWELNLNAWDVAAGSLILTEAGGKVTDFSGGGAFMEKKQLVASNGLIHDEFLGIIRESLQLK